MNKEITEGKYSFYKFYPFALLQGVIFVLLVGFVFKERNVTAILFVLFIALVLYPVMVSVIFPLGTSFRVLQNGIEISLLVPYQQNQSNNGHDYSQ